MSTTPTSASLTHRVSSAMLWNSALFPVKLIIALGSGVILTRVLSKHDYAQYSLILYTAAFIGTWVDLGMERTVSRFTPEVELSAGRKGLEKFFAILFGVKLLVIMPVVIAFAIAPDFFIHILALGDEGNILLWGIAGLVILGAVADAFVQFLYTHFKQIATNLLDIVASLGQPLMVVAFALAGTGVVGVVIAMLIASAGLDVLAAWRANSVASQIPLRNGGMPERLWDRFAHISALNFVFTATGAFGEPGFAALVLVGSKQLVAVAVLAVGYRFVQYFLRFLVAPLTGIQTPLFARLWAEKRMANVREAYSTLTKFYIFLLVPCGIAMILLAPRLIPFLFTESYDAAAAVSIVLVFFLFGETLTSIPQAMLIVFEESRAVLFSRLLALLTVPLLLILVPPFGALGAALSLGGPRFLSRVYSTFYTEKHYQTRFPFAFLLRVSVATAFAGTPMLLLRDWDWWWSIPTSVFFTVAFLAVFKVLGGFDAQEKERLKTLKLPFKELILKWL
jgi:O-antigen/teichoic acid export membrane protein